MTTADPQPDSTEAPAPSAPQGRISPALMVFLITGVLGLAAAGITLLASQSSDSSSAPRASIAEAGSGPVRDIPAPEFTLRTLAGNTVTLEDYRGRIVYLNFWATWCLPCVRELPALQQFASEQGEDGAVVLALNQGETVTEVRDFLNGLGVRGLTVLMDEDALTRRLYNVNNFPTTYIIGPDGVQQYMKLGEFTLEEMYEYLEAVQEAYAEPEPDPAG
jgi:thiol-disulfide isomerase/thioredoxin